MGKGKEGAREGAKGERERREGRGNEGRSLAAVGKKVPECVGGRRRRGRGWRLRYCSSGKSKPLLPATAPALTVSPHAQGSGFMHNAGCRAGCGAWGVGSKVQGPGSKC
eukprot:952198-Rhodomonas_salina.1